MNTLALGIVWVWLLLCAFAQLVPRSSDSTLQRWRWYFPEWRLFAPEPATLDYYLCVRSKSPQGSVTPLRPLFVPTATWARGLWNPEARRRKIVRDLMQALLNELESLGTSTDGLPDSIVLSDPYLLLLGACAATQRAGKSVQFGVLAKGPEEESLLLLSRWHLVAEPAS